MTEGELKDTELFVFTGNLVFKRIFYKGNPKLPLLFEIMIRLYQVNMKG